MEEAQQEPWEGGDETAPHFHPPQAAGAFGVSVPSVSSPGSQPQHKETGLSGIRVGR